MTSPTEVQQFPAVFTRPSLDGKKTISAGVQVTRYLGGHPVAHAVGSLDYYVTVNGKVLTTSSHGSTALLTLRSNPFFRWADLAAEYAGYLDLGDQRVAVTPEQVAALEAGLAAARSTPVGQAITAYTDALIARDQARTQAAHAWQDTHRARLQERGVPWLRLAEPGEDGPYVLTRAYRMTPEEQAEWQAFTHRRELEWHQGAAEPLPLLHHLDAEMDAVAPTCGEITPAQADALRALSARRVQARDEQVRATRAAEEARVAAVFARARETGAPQVLESWMGEDHRTEDNSYSEFVSWAQPDGTVTRTTTPTY